VLTAIDLDHQQWLGATLREIALEKCGIVKARVPVVSARQHTEVLQVVKQATQECNASLHIVERPIGYEVSLAGSHQLWNASQAVRALEIAGINISEAATRSGLAAVVWQGRFQRINDQLVLDGAHNEAAAKCLAQTWREVFKNEKATLVLGILRDKNLAEICRALLPIAAFCVTTPVRSGRTSNAEDIRRTIQDLDSKIPCAITTDLKSALEIAHRQPHRILLTGSLFLVGEALAMLQPGGSPPEMSSQ